MLASCSYCGRIHDKKYVCPQKEQKIKERQSYRAKKSKKIYDFHRSRKWTYKSLSIRQRDNYCCQICARGLYKAERTFETEGISVHHIIPVSEDWDRRLDDDILLTVCEKHHEMAEKGEIPRGELLRIAEEQEQERECPVCG